MQAVPEDVSANLGKANLLYANKRYDGPVTQFLFQAGM